MRSPENPPSNLGKKENIDFSAIFAEKRLTRRERLSIDILQREEFGDLNSQQKMAIFDYGQFQELGPAVLKRRKDLFAEVREDETERIVTRIIYNDFLVNKYEKFYSILEQEDLQTDLVKPEFKRVKKLLAKAETRMVKAHPQIETILALKKSGFNNDKISNELNIPIKFVETAVRALIFFKKIEPTPSGKALVEKQDKFLMQVAMLRFKKLGNAEIARQLDTHLGKVESAARFLLWIKLIKPITKSEGGKIRWRRKENKEKVKKFLNTLNPNKRISLRTAHRDSGLKIGYDLFSSLYFELGNEQPVPPIRKFAKIAKGR